MYKLHIKKIIKNAKDVQQKSIKNILNVFYKI